MCRSAQNPKSGRMVHTKRHEMGSDTSKQYEPAAASLDCVNLFLHWHVGFPMHTGIFQGTEISCFPGFFLFGPSFTRWNPGPVLDSIHKFTETAQHAETFLANPPSKPTRVKMASPSFCIHVARTYQRISQTQCHRQACFYPRRQFQSMTIHAASKCLLTIRTLLGLCRALILSLTSPRTRPTNHYPNQQRAHKVNAADQGVNGVQLVRFWACITNAGPFLGSNQKFAEALNTQKRLLHFFVL